MIESPANLRENSPLGVEEEDKYEANESNNSEEDKIKSNSCQMDK